MRAKSSDKLRSKLNCLVVVSVILAGFIGPPVHAQGQGRDSDASASLGYVGTTGNTESQTFETDLLYNLRQDNWEHALEFRALYTQQEEVTTGERYFLQGKSDFELDADDYLFGKASYTDDRFTGFSYQATVSGGYGHYFYDSDDFLLEAFGGAGYRQNAFREGGSEGEVIITAGENLEWAFTETARLTQSLTSEIGQDLTVTRFEIGLVTSLVGQLSTKVAFEARNISEVPAGREKTDTQTSISLLYEF